MPKNLGDLENVRTMRNSLEQITDAYFLVKRIMSNPIMESLEKYNIELEILEKNLEKQFNDIKPKICPFCKKDDFHLISGTQNNFQCNLCMKVF